MQAVAVRTFRAPAELMEVPSSPPGPGELLVRLEAAGVNPLDWKIVDGLYEGRRPHLFPIVLGVDGAGTVEALGEGTRRFRVGDRIAGSFLHDPVGVGTYAQRTTVPETNALAVVPPALPSTEAAALPTAGITAVEVLELLSVPSGGTLLVVGASGGVGSIATQLASRRGIRVVAAARPETEATVRALGAVEVLAPGDGLLPELKRRYPGGVDGLLDTGSDKPTFARLAPSVRRGGTALTTTFVADTSAAQADGIRRVNFNLQPRAETMARLLAEYGSGDLRPPVSRVRPLAEGPQALIESRARRSVGKTVLSIPR
ncbi:MAG TPA: NADP-dependent oxidoreductase [Thermoplasmata archaeon]|nr:NADP-dependent oxidoreductase [Thermoplasmata archaeon]